jgi:hypothetical protein
MKNTLQLRRTAAWLAVWALPGPVELIALSVYFVLAPICAAWLGVDLLRKPG